jgi:hypothetical protein
MAFIPQEIYWYIIVLETLELERLILDSYPQQQDVASFKKN